MLLFIGSNLFFPRQFTVQRKIAELICIKIFRNKFAAETVEQIADKLADLLKLNRIPVQYCKFNPAKQNTQQ